MRGSLARLALYVVALAIVWSMLWDRLSVANAIAGVLVACVVLVVFPPVRRIHDARPAVIRPLATLHLIGFVGLQLVISNLLVAREILARRSRIRTGIVACRMHTDAPGLITLISNLIALTPGMMTVEARAEPPTLYVHVLLLRDVVSARRDVAHLERLVLRAFGTDGDRLDAQEVAP